MEKSKTTEVDKPKSNDNNGTVLKYEQSVYLKHRRNQAIDYKLGGEYYRFEAYERKKVADKVLKTRQFPKFKKYFNIEYDNKKGE